MFVDTATLYPVSLADLVLRLAELGMFELLWSDHLLGEVERVLVQYKGLAAQQAAYFCACIRRAFPEGRVAPDDYLSLVASRSGRSCVPDRIPLDSPDAPAAACHRRRCRRLVWSSAALAGAAPVSRHPQRLPPRAGTQATLAAVDRTPRLDRGPAAGFPACPSDLRACVPPTSLVRSDPSGRLRAPDRRSTVVLPETSHPDRRAYSRCASPPRATSSAVDASTATAMALASVEPSRKNGRAATTNRSSGFQEMSAWT